MRVSLSGTLALVALAAVFAVGTDSALAGGTCPSHAPEARLAAIKAAGTCQKALQIDQHCSIGALGDLSPGAAVVRKCEKDFKSRLSKRLRARYESARNVCIEKYSKQRGSGARSVTIHCLEEVAAKFSAKYGRR